MAPSAYRMRYQDLVERDGEKCAYEGPHSDERPPFQIHHVNGDPTDHRLANSKLACAKHNVIKYHELLKAARSEREGEKPGGELTTHDNTPLREISYESKTNLEAEPVYRQWIITTLAQGDFSWHYLMTEGAERFRLSPNTTNRYLEKLTAPSGPVETYREDFRAGRAILMCRLKPKFWTQTDNEVSQD